MWRCSATAPQEARGLFYHSLYLLFLFFFFFFNLKSSWCHSCQMFGLHLYFWQHLQGIF